MIPSQPSSSVSRPDEEGEGNDRKHRKEKHSTVLYETVEFGEVNTPVQGHVVEMAPDSRRESNNGGQNDGLPDACWVLYSKDGIKNRG